MTKLAKLIKNNQGAITRLQIMLGILAVLVVILIVQNVT